MELCKRFIDLSSIDRLKLARLCLVNHPNTNKSLLCSVLKLNRSSLYWIRRRNDLDILNKVKIQELLCSNPCYGHRRVAIYFGWSYSKARRIMRKFDIYPKYKKSKYPFKPKDLAQTPVAIPNLLKPILKQNDLHKPNQIWSSDFTYLKYKHSFLYLATVIDSFSKDIVGFEVSNRHNTNLVTKALDMAIRRFGIPGIFHSDQGSEYTSYDYQELLNKLGIGIFLSKKASPWENGYQESFYGKFKFELGNLNQYETLEKQWKQFTGKSTITTIKEFTLQSGIYQLTLEENILSLKVWSNVSSFSEA